MSAGGARTVARLTAPAWPKPLPDALQALLAHPKLLKLLRTAIADPGQFERRGGLHTGNLEPLEAWQARAVRTALRKVSDHA